MMWFLISVHSVQILAIVLNLWDPPRRCASKVWGCAARTAGGPMPSSPAGPQLAARGSTVAAPRSTQLPFAGPWPPAS